MGVDPNGERIRESVSGVYTEEEGEVGEDWLSGGVLHHKNDDNDKRR